MRYDTPVDNMTDREYLEFTTELFTGFDKILKSNGVVIYNINYGNENAELLFKTINEIIEKTPFTIGDVIVWKKTNALPNCHSNNKTTRIWEFVFIFCRDTEYNTFNSNKKAVGKHDTGQLTYENIFNFVEAKNNDGPCPFNKATYSSELCKKLLLMYAPKNAVVYDPFMGTGTTAIACYQLSLNYIGSEISAKQCEWANNRINEEMAQIRFEI